MIKKIGILTSGGDSSGMNAAIRAVVRTAIFNGIEVCGIRRGYKGLYEGDFVNLDKYSVSEIIYKGGTFLGSSRLPEFKDLEIRKVALKNLKEKNIEALVVIGGDGSFKGAEELTKMGINCIGIPGTIDNDINSTDYTIGFDTALNVIVSAIDKIRDTSSSHNRCNIVEIMGRDCGDLSLWSGIATGCEYIITKETGFDKEALIQSLKDDKVQGKKHSIIALAEHIVNPFDLSKELEKETGFETRVTVLGHIQRGGTPSAFDRVLASRFGNEAVKLLMDNIGGVCLGIRDNKIINLEISKAINMKKPETNLFQLSDELK